MSAAREEVLGRVRDALVLAPPRATTIPRDYRTGRTLPDDERIDLLIDRLVDYRAGAHTCTTGELPRTLADVLAAHRVGRLGVPAGLDAAWLSAFDGEVVRDGPEVSVGELDAFDGVVTGCAVACAETGTLFLDAGPDQGRRALTLVPDLHVCVVACDDVAVGVPEAVARLRPTQPTTLISGPSATSDIELERVEGVHGPRTLEVIIIRPAEQRK